MNSSEKFQVYSPGGELICEATIEDGIYRYKSSTISRDIQFTDKGIFGVLQLDNDDDIYMRLVKINIR